MHILIVEDDRRLNRILRRMLEEDRHVVESALDARTGLDLARLPGLDAIVLDIGLPDGSGLEVARRLRAAGARLPILMLTARDTVGDRVLGLDSGADDYLVKPFAYDELAARLRALVRRAASLPSPEVGRLVNGPIVLDEGSRLVTVAGRPVELSPREFALLECLLRHAGQVLSRDQLLDHAWPSGVAVTLNAVDTYVHYLRAKLGDAAERIVTVRGVGYRLALPS
ncbi:MAG TPA: response regulator transcription factor [Candidatus Limnocylindrales bacterium]|nr:response regulator transcription factor [Candidatus Limnocylindrales bacterium]